MNQDAKAKSTNFASAHMILVSSTTKIGRLGAFLPECHRLHHSHWQGGHLCQSDEGQSNNRRLVNLFLLNSLLVPIQIAPPSISLEKTICRSDQAWACCRHRAFDPQAGDWHAYQHLAYGASQWDHSYATASPNRPWMSMNVKRLCQYHEGTTEPLGPIKTFRLPGAQWTSFRER